MQAAPGSPPVSMTGLMMTRPSPFRATSRHLTTKARALLAGRLHGAAPTLFGGRPKKPKGSVAATKRDEATAKAAHFHKVLKQPQAVSA